MTQHWTVKDLEYWDERIQEKVDAFGLDCFPQEFEVCDHEQMLGYMAYHGLPAHYPHWSYGKAFEKLKTLYDYGISGLPYEMVINSNPALAYLMRENSLCLQVLTIAHVYGHNDFFKNNFSFRDTNPSAAVARSKLRADRVRSYAENPAIGLTAVESLLDAAHALSLNCRRHTAIRKLDRREQQQQAVETAAPPYDPYANIHKRPEHQEPDLNQLPLDPEEDLLLFIAEHNPYLEDWQRDLLQMVHEEAQYFIPQMETKIINEGWASYWHYTIMNSLELPEDLHLEFLVHHNQVVRPHPGDINPYHIGFSLWQDLRRRYDQPTNEDIERYGEPDKSGLEKLFEIRETDRDASFLRRFLNQGLMHDLDLFEYQHRNGRVVVDKVSDQDNWQAVKDTLLANTGMATVPVIRIRDADFHHSRILYLQHEHEGRDLHPEYMEKTLSYLHQLWGRQVLLETHMQGEELLFRYDEEGLGEISR